MRATDTQIKKNRKKWLALLSILYILKCFVLPAIGWTNQGIDLLTAIFYLGIFGILYFAFMDRPMREFKLFKKRS